ncbi:MAG: cytochrome-c peroxidase [Pseudomonadales bacterium]
MNRLKIVSSISIILLTACSGGGSDALATQNNAVETPPVQDAPAVVPEPPVTPVDPPVANDPSDTALRAIIDDENLIGDASIGRTLPDISDPIAQLGRDLFFSKSLGGGFDSACVSCHHPSLGGADGLMLPVGVEALNADLLGPGREHVDGLPPVPRHSPTVFNVGLWDTSLFWDSRVEAIDPVAGQNGSDSDIRTPDTAFITSDANAGANLAAAQALFPVTSAEEMRTASFESGADNNTVRNHLAARIGDYGIGAGEIGPNTWASRFQQAFDSTETNETLISYANIAQALGEYERSMVFTNNPWKQYVEGDNNALSEQQKQGAILFFTAADDGGGGCSSCHSGDLFSDEEHHVVAFPQFGPGKGDGNGDDFGRERETGERADRYRLRTPSLLNIAQTAPYGHTGVYPTLNAVLDHYNNERDSVDDFFDNTEWCDTQQFAAVAGCENLYPFAEGNSNSALQQLNANRQNGTADFLNTNLNNNERDQIVAFLQALTDPCVTDRDCLTPWIPELGDPGPDGNQLNAVDQNGDPL